MRPELLLRVLQAKTTVKKVRNLLRRLWFPFSRGALAGAVALAINFLIRLGGLVSFPPEASIERVISIIPASIQEPAVQRLGDVAGELGLLTATIVAIFAYGLFGVLFETVFLRRTNALKGFTRLEKFLTYSLIPWILFGVVLFPVLGDSPFGISVASAPDSVFFFPPALLLVQFVFGSILSWEYRNRSDLQITKEVSHPEIVAKSPTSDSARRISRREFVEKSALVVASLSLVAVGTDAILSAFLSTNSRTPNGNPFSVSGTPAVFGDPRLKSLVDSEVTSSNSFYRVAIDIIDPTVDVATWLLQLKGLVANPKTYSLSELQNLPSMDQYTTFECVSNVIDGNLISNAKWTGVRISDLFADAGEPLPNAQYVVFYSVDGYSVGIPLSRAMMQDSMLAYKMNDETLPAKHGYPLRAVIPGLYGMMSAKWINRIELADSVYSGYWQTRGWTNYAAVATVAFITVPGDNASVSLSNYNGSVILGGVAFAGDRGISKVEVSVDGGKTWQQAQLKPPISKLTWALWAFEWFPTKTGMYNVYARATDGTGATQTSQQSPTFPNGATGYAMIQLNVTS